MEANGAGFYLNGIKIKYYEPDIKNSSHACNAGRLGESRIFVNARPV